ncbi:hypothetical protein [Dysgonomonas termitidis]|uniref:Uncharacterized protein n=1 Tax=Dysgonomonas termitidis TaxID=1516126 RepID=A0ABV9KVI7_9BACT
MKKINLEVTLDATAAQLQEIGITIPDFCGQKMRAWDFNTITPIGPCAMVFFYYSENDYFEIPMRYIRFVDLTIEEANFIYPDALEPNITIIPGLSIDRYIYNLEQKYLLTGPSRVIYYEVNLSDMKLRAILSETAHRYRLIENFVQDLRAIGLKPVCDEEGIRLEYDFKDSLQVCVNKLLNSYVGFWRSIAIMVGHDRENRIARYYIKYNLITGKDLTYDELIAAVEYVQKGM